ncbi:B-cell receptor CD22 isoform X2 [Sander lucioperca]|uniref:B-cell receptor CD22 isoform X2 n=1 Tax=Sander lucioperca TaxID=283035 RepID=UPI0016539BB1|nr:B-cell receptor CD22 isoform X2 [Sander lucioperca]
MKMNALAVGWLVFLALIKNFSCAPQNPFTLKGPLTATEGSCIEIKCNVTNNVEPKDAYWFWIKNPHWSVNDFTGTIIYSTNETVRPVSSDFADRVKYTGSPSLSWNNRPRSPPVLCSILICNLNKTDSGNYAFRFVGTKVWKTEDANLKVIENPCPITFEKPAAVNESGMITLTCSTSSSCTSKLQIGGLTQLSPTPQQRNNEKTKSTTVTLTVNWNDDGKEFSCKTQDNEDKYLIKNISVTVEYAPKYTLAEISSQNVEEGRSVTLTCSAKGSPTPTFTWVKNKQDAVVKTGAEWMITSITESQDGEYHCKAANKHGTTQSNPVTIEVQYRPEIEVKSSASVVKEGEIMTLTCKVKRSNPPPSTYSWFKDEKAIHQEQTHQYVVERIQPEDRGSYTCSATNTVGTGTSGSLLITVEYGPWNTTIRNVDKKVKVGSSLAFYCFTDANPAPLSYSWYRYNMKKPTDSSKWRSKNSKEEVIYLDRVERADEACYMCNATNEISTGHDSEPVCIEVLYPPTEPMLTMDTELREDQLITISCTVESFPLSTLYLTRTSESKPQSSELLFTQLWPDNTLHHKFNVTSTHTGVYTCSATNSEGSKTSKPTTLVVKYRPKDVTVKAEPALIVNENKSLTLRCSAQSHPPVTSVTWMKTTDGKSEIIRKGLTFILKSVSPSDSGLYSCAANNGIGTGNSQKAEVKVKYAPKHTNITRAAEQQQPDGTRSVELSCSSHSYPPVTQYSWYKIKAEEGDEKVSNHQTYTVYSNEPGSYYCIAKNEINQRKSDPVHLFDRTLMKVLYIFLFLIILFIIILIFFVYRRKKSIQQGTMNTATGLGFLGWWNDARRRNRMNNPSMAGPFRSRDDLLSDQPCHPNGQRCQPRLDSTPTSNVNSVYCTVNLPSGKQGPSAQKPIRQQGGHTQDYSLNYASLHFGNTQKHNPTKAEDEYSMVSKQKPLKKNDERLEDYENVSAAHTAKSQNASNYDTDTSEDEIEINYSQVSFKAKPGLQRAGRDSSSSDEEVTQYSEVKI